MKPPRGGWLYHPDLEDRLARLAAAGMAPPSHPAWEAFLQDCDEALVQRDGLEARLRDERSALATMTSRLAALMETLVTGLLMEGPDGRVALANAALGRLFGLPGSHWKLLGEEAATVLRECAPRLRDTSLIDQALAERLTSREPIHFPDIAMRDGRYFCLDVMPIHIAGEGPGFLWKFQDITARRWDERRLEATLKELAEARDKAVELGNLKSDFLANMSHEIRTPMNGIIGMAGLLMDAPLEGEYREYLETIRSCGESLMALINDILDFSKIEAGRLDLESIPFDLQEVVDDLVSILGVKAHAKQLELVSWTSASVPRKVQGDPVRLRQVLSNLVDNALKFTEEGFVEVRTQMLAESEDEALLRFEVQDTGPGVTQDALPRLFQSFSQEDTSTTRKYGGTGLGLSICKRLVELMGGNLGVDSKPGKGSTFWLTLRFRRLPDQPPAIDPSQLPAIFLVGLPPHLYRTLRFQLSAWGLRVDHLEASPAGLEYLRRHPQAILLAIPEGGAQSRAFLREVREDSALGGSVRVLALANRYSASEHKDVRAAGFREILGLPLRVSQLHGALAKAKQHLDEAARKEPEPPIQEEQPRILLAEDNAVNQRLAVAVLKKQGFTEVDVVANGLEALNAAMAHSYGLILMDCQMPVMEGYEATRRIRERQAGGRRTPIIALTAHALVGDREKCIDCGMDDYLTKPLRPDALQQVMKKWLRTETSN